MKTKTVRRLTPIETSREAFFYYAGECNRTYRSGHGLQPYRKIIDLHRVYGDLRLLLDDENFYPLIMKTLEKWNMNQRGAKLTSIDNLKRSILCHQSNLFRLYQYKLHSITTEQIHREIIGLLQDVFPKLEVMKSKKRLVGVSKTLHFLLPDLVMPIDNKYTLKYFPRYANDEFATFKDIFIKTHEITRRLALTQADVSGEIWNTSVPKLIDNAIIAYVK